MLTELPLPTVADIVALLRLQRLDQRCHIGRSPRNGTARVYGGQLLGQSIMAMGAAAPRSLVLHSLQAYFLRSGDITQDLHYEVDVMKESRSFSLLRVMARQNGVAVFTAMASFHAPEGEHQRLATQPPAPAPEDLESETDFLTRVGWQHASSVTFSACFFTQIVERRSATWRHPREGGAAPPHSAFWCRLREPVDEDPLLHQALLAYLSDLDLMYTAMRPRGIAPRDPDAMASSLDHVMWFHHPVRADKWFYYDIDSPYAAHNRGLGRGAVYQNGQLVATAMQEGLLRTAK